MSNENLDIIPEWVIDFTKGGPGSGEHKGHPFRGNGSTGAVFQAGAHNDRPNTTGWGHGQHLDAANSRVQAGLAALHSGNYGMAMHHFNEAAYHAATAAKILNKNGADRDLHQSAKVLYASAHHAGEAAMHANKATYDYARAIRSGIDSHTASLLALKAQGDLGRAYGAANTTSSANSEIQAGRLTGAMGRSAAQNAAVGQ
jgi:hypothetical protein